VIRPVKNQVKAEPKPRAPRYFIAAVN
jgi:hypothetical protein